MHIDLSSKRAALAIRFFSYGVMTVSTIVLTVLAIFYAMGYRFDQSSGTFAQGGLVQFRSTPDSASVSVDGKFKNITTPGRADLAAGQHSVRMYRSGYDTWSKSISLLPGQLLWLNYARLIPTAVSTTQIKQLPGVGGMVVSPDHKWLALQEHADAPVFTFVDTSDPKKPVFANITLPEDQVLKTNGSYGQFSIVEWDASSRYVLVRRQLGDVVDFIRVDRTKAENTTNISKLFQLPINQAHFAAGNPAIVFVRTGDDNVLRRLDIGAASASAALMTGVSQFTVHGDDVVAYVAADQLSGQQVVGLYRHGKAEVLRSYPPAKQLLIAYTQYVGHDYLAIRSDSGLMQILRDPAAGAKDTAEFAHFNLGKNPSWLMFSSNGRMLAAGAGNDMATYDIETGDEYHATVHAAADITTPLRWLDDFYLYTDAGNRLTIFEFDGQNQHDIVSVSAGFAAALSQDGKVLFSIQGTQGAYSLQASALVND